MLMCLSGEGLQLCPASLLAWDGVLRRPSIRGTGIASWLRPRPLDGHQVSASSPHCVTPALFSVAPIMTLLCPEGGCGHFKAIPGVSAGAQHTGLPTALRVIVLEPRAQDLKPSGLCPRALHLSCGRLNGHLPIGSASF